MLSLFTCCLRRKSPVQQTTTLTSGDDSTLYIPETLKDWPWPRSINPFYEITASESLDWLHSYQFFPPKAQLKFDRCDYGRLASLAYPRLNKEHNRIGCDLMNVFFVVEDGTDEASPEVTKQRVALLIDALPNPSMPRPADEWRGAEIVRAFWHRAITTPGFRRSTAGRFLDHFLDYLQSIVTEAADRAKEVADGPPVYTLESFLAVRRRTVGAQPSFVLLELGLPQELDDDAISEAVNNADMRELSSLATDMILIGNDLVSYNRERATGAVHNIVTVVLKNPPQSPPPKNAPTVIKTAQDSVNWVAAYHQVLLERFLALYETATAHHTGPAFQHLASGLGNWVRANDQWSFESVRYFGARGAEVQMTRVVELLPLQEVY
ncbi:hypothetical protein Sste5346_008559 [Sporothrix stenoceras]|uniref:Terpene synthase n=1 Tax=Sporothrix stenoceras TaxID=5173 RepID=A0ABR3YQ46_9PEZI